MPLVTGYLFLLGFAAGVALLTITSYSRVSPRWLRWLLLASGLFIMGRYATMALFTSINAPRDFWALRHFWFATSLGFPLASVFAVDQLIRHPAITPKRLLFWLSPFIMASCSIIFFGAATPIADKTIGWLPQLDLGWQRLHAAQSTLFVLAFLGFGALLARKIPSWQIRFALLALMAGHCYLAFDGIILALGGWYFRPYLYSEIFMLLAIWCAFETAAALQQTT